MKAIEGKRVDWIPPALLLAIALGALAFIGNPSTWVTLTVAGLAMGLLIFIMSSGLTLVFGLMDVMNFAHGLFIAIGAYVAVSVMKLLSAAAGSESFLVNLGALLPALLAAMLAASLLGLAFERIIIKPVYGQHLKQILITTGGMIVAEQLIHVFWGPDLLPLQRPSALRGAFLIGDMALEKFRLSAVLIGLAVFAGMLLLLNRTKIGLLIRAGVENKEMVEAMGYRIRRLFVGVFAAGSALAGLGGCLWGMNQQIVIPQIGGQVNVLLFIVIIIGGLGSTLGCLFGALLVGLITNYVGFVAPKLAMFSSIGLMVAVLLWRPQGLYPVVNR